MSPGKELVPPDRIREAAAGLEGVAVRTPLVEVPDLAARVPGGTPPRLHLKLESLQRGGSFKLRGAWTYLRAVDDAEAERGVITYSSGNHAQAVALAAGLRGVPATVVMPTTAPSVKREGARRRGARVVEEGTTSEERRRRAMAMAEEEGLAVIPPFDHPRIIAGQGTAALEVLEDLPEADLFVAPVGGGGLLAGTAAAVKGLRPEARVVGVEAEGAASMRRSLEADEPVTLDRIETIADGLAPVRPGDLTFHHARELVDEVVTVPDDAIRRAAAALFREARVVVEYSGAASLAGLLHGSVAPAGARSAVCLVSGGNLDPGLVPEVLAVQDGA